MRIVRPIAMVFYYLTRILAFVYLTSTFFIITVLALKNCLPAADFLPIHISDARFEILIPATDKPLFLGRYTSWGIIEIALGMGLYGLFFFLLSRIFNAFRQQKLFTSQAIKSLSDFSKANLILPPAFLIFLYFHPDYLVEGGEILVTSLHILLAVFALFQAAVFSEGFTLQQEQDLTI